MNQLLSVRRMAVAVRVMDGLTGEQALPGSVHIFMKDGGAKVKKEGGYVVFWDNGMDQRTLVLQSSYYVTEEIELDLVQLRKKKTPSLYVWMMPGRSFSYPPEMNWTEKKGEPNAIINIPVKESAGVIQLQGAYPLDRLCPEQIQLRVPDELEIEGRTLLIRRQSDGHEEFFAIWDVRNRSMGLYETYQPLEEIYSIYDTEIFIVIQVKADDKGRYLSL